MKHPVIDGRRAVRYERLSGLALGWLYRRVTDHVLTTLPSGGRVLDVGTGPGRLPAELARRSPDVQVACVDPSSDMIDAAVRRAAAAGVADRVASRVASAESLPFPDKSFDAVVSTLSSHHWAEPGRAIDEQVRVLRPGGRLWVVDLRVASPRTVPQTLARHFPVVEQPRLWLLASVALSCYEAVRPTVPADGPTEP